jgi:thiosulfate/3-mercaptopyruvate sulfurtransferase
MTNVWVSAAELAARSYNPTDLVILDVRFTPEAGADHAAYLAGHLPGAYFVDFPKELAEPATNESGRRPLPSATNWQTRVWKWGITPSSTVVVYDDRAGLSAARAWWILKWSGIDVRILDGGLAAWRSGGYRLDTAVPATGGGTAIIAPGRLPVLTATETLDTARDGILIDARKAVSYLRTDAAQDGTPGGHIPGARSYPAASSLAPDGTMLPEDQLRAAFAELGVTGTETVGVYCGGGVAATHVIAALAGLDIEAALYPGSWSEWVRDPSRPIQYADAEQVTP